MNAPIAIVGCFLTWFLGTAFLPDLLGLSNRTAWMLRGIFWAIGLTGAGIALWLHSRIRKQTPQSERQEDDLRRDVDLLVQEAKKRFLQSSLGRRAKFESVPSFFVIGPSQAGKTTTILNSGLEPELLAGLARQGSAVIPTSTINLWLSAASVLIEVGGDIWSSDAAWRHFIKRFRPSSAAAVSATLGARAVILCLPAEDLVRANGMSALITLAQLANERINELAAELGIQLPVYVVITRANRLTFFEQFCSNLTEAEVQEAWGATLPIKPAQDRAFLDFQSNRILEAFESIFLALDRRRTSLLSLESNPEKLPAIYQFPREFHKLSKSLVPFLVELSKPRQIGISSYLRGFYFTGLRPLNAIDPAGRSRRIPQFVFVNRLFRNLLAGDQQALCPSATSRKTAFLQRLIAAFAITLAVAGISGLTLFYYGNRALQRKAADAALASRDTRGGSAVNCSVASTNALQQLEALREVLSQIDSPRKTRSFALKIVFYQPDKLYAAARAVYFDRFQKVLLDGTQVALLDYFNRLPDKPGLNQDYGDPYNALRAYLVTTSHPEKSHRGSVSPVLQQFWQGGCPISPAARELAARQFDFYTETLRLSDTIERPEDRTPVARARKFLNGLTGSERVYRAVIADANNKVRSIQFNRDYPGSDTAVLNSREISGAFTKDGWALVHNGLANAKRLFEGETWVLGADSPRSIDFTGLEQQLLERYKSDYAAEWKAYLSQTHVRGYSGLSDAAYKLTLLSSARSPLLAAFYLISKNTALEGLGPGFQPVQKVVDPKSENYNWINGSNGPYMKALLELQIPVENLSKLPQSQRDADPGTEAATQGAAGNAKLAVLALAQQFHPDPVEKTDQTVVRLLQAPILNVERYTKIDHATAVNAHSAQLCAAMHNLVNKYPFASSGQRASLAELFNFFRRPDGALWQFYTADLTGLLHEDRGVFAVVPNSPAKVNPYFVRSFNNMSAVSTYLTAGGSLNFSFSVQEYSGDGLKTIKLSIGGQGGAITSVARQFVWPGDADRGIEWTLEDSPRYPQQYPGVWGVFDWFSSATWQSKSSDSYIVTWPLTLGGKPRQGPDGQPLKARLEVHMPIPLFQNGYLRAMSCSKDVVQPGT